MTEVPNDCGNRSTKMAIRVKCWKVEILLIYEHLPHAVIIWFYEAPHKFMILSVQGSSQGHMENLNIFYSPRESFYEISLCLWFRPTVPKKNLDHFRKRLGTVWRKGGRKGWVTPKLRQKISTENTLVLSPIPPINATKNNLFLAQ